MSAVMMYAEEKVRASIMFCTDEDGEHYIYHEHSRINIDAEAADKLATSWYQSGEIQGNRGADLNPVTVTWKWAKSVKKGLMMRFTIKDRTYETKLTCTNAEAQRCYRRLWTDAPAERV